jgi:hypothetical protein
LRRWPVAIWFSIVEATGNADVDVVQRFHFVEYGIITFLFYRAWRALEDPAILLLPALAGLLVGTADEWLQWFIPNRVVRDCRHSLNGIAIGCGLCSALVPIHLPGSPGACGRDQSCG